MRCRFIEAPARGMYNDDAINHNHTAWSVHIVAVTLDLKDNDISFGRDTQYVPSIRSIHSQRMLDSAGSPSFPHRRYLQDLPEAIRMAVARLHAEHPSLSPMTRRSVAGASASCVPAKTAPRGTTETHHTRRSQSLPAPQRIPRARHRAVPQPERYPG
jgi:hypothetical protein